MTAEGLKPASVYVFQIRARTAAGYGVFSRRFEFETIPVCKSFSLLSAHVSVMVTRKESVDQYSPWARCQPPAASLPPRRDPFWGSLWMLLWLQLRGLTPRSSLRAVPLVLWGGEARGDPWEMFKPCFERLPSHCFHPYSIELLPFTF